MGTTVPVALVAGATQAIKSSGPARYRGITVRELSGAALVLKIYDNGSAASGTIIDIVSVAANATVSYTLPDDIHASNGLFIERVSGTSYEGSVRLG